MPDKETPLSERVVKEAIGVGMDSPLRDPILEAVDEAEGGGSSSKRMVPAAGLLLGAGAAIGYLFGRSELPDSEMGDEVKEELSDIDIPAAEMDPQTEADESEAAESSGGRGWLSKLVVLGVTVVAALAWRRRRAAEDEWEPIEEFEPATDAVSMDASEEGEDEEGEDEEAAEATAEGETEDEDEE
ncbi:hypothetical protein [Natronosalvus rutilus]|uniref:MYXO-CTERM domain-containing protein n=1 Tax=Natronosalvus rutilus TaxID=2953753 RepID=A0A9E7N8M9_9EURY|nr:hypothetical protein [Natronosalvus rutilus]UTF52418.1 hypothetical protein NGM29_11520 [Natronosalvus rutilus]